MGFQGWSQAWSQGSRTAKSLDPWDRPGTREGKVKNLFGRTPPGLPRGEGDGT